MDLSLVNPVPEYLLKALCSTLIHSLWQGLILSFTVGIIILFTKKSSADLRYKLLTASLFLFAAGSIYTFFRQLKSVSVQSVSTENAAAMKVFALSTGNELIDKSIGNEIVNYCIEHSGEIILGWFLIICIQLLRMAAGFYSLYQLKKVKIFAVDYQLKEKLKMLSHKLGISQAIEIMQSGVAQSPVVIGYFKPIILIPLGMLSHLSPQELEAILIHELAHIRRKDYLVNILQRFLEIVFFFNPAVLWISNLIRNERENCCDDIAISITGSKTTYIQALISCEEYKMTTPDYALGFSGNSNHLLHRVRRMVSNHNQSLNIMERTTLTICLIVAVSFTAVFTKTNAKTISEVTPVSSVKSVSAKVAAIKPNAICPAPVVEVKVDSVPAKKAKTKTHSRTWVYNSGSSQISVDGKTYRFNENEDKISELYINDVKIPEDQLASYQPEIDKLKVLMKEGRKQAEEGRRQAEIGRKQAEEGRRQAELGRKQAAEGRAEAERGRKQAEEGRRQAELGRKQAAEGRVEAERGRKQAEEGRRQAELGRKQAAEGRIQAEEGRKQAEEGRIQAELARKEAAEARAQAEEDRKQAAIELKLAEEEAQESRKEAAESLKQAQQDLLDAKEELRLDLQKSQFKTKGATTIKSSRKNATTIKPEKGPKN
ncbi:Signal transducer regulating beta-lactamase production, contains metallopeptidase domain [Pseudarcicella hirudinis]|uniref:Signal transducer regulating beta-lactamase production, contains metallopeptidase domain n=1 Tax=Pseudarcicella hirudinis TaxID=1079859 RepID=A0A1I5NZ90_9BACT|nr:M56 family metallopeptidase [Pseudarcicella hirudinis]SFP27083.1 Signal transducer regulating beta-lactamase production, contains metallopeptidase domain [Pseudarcicella hirudinis]